jgi:hypothetical protein
MQTHAKFYYTVASVIADTSITLAPAAANGHAGVGPNITLSTVGYPSAPGLEMLPVGTPCDIEISAHVVVPKPLTGP